jgi:hypothetical protein
MTVRAMWRVFGAALVIGVGVAACSDSGSSDCGGIVQPLRLLTPSTAALSLDVGAQGQVSATLSGGCVNDPQTVTWITSDAQVATVSAAGAVAAVGAGTATITGTAFDNKTRTAITVIVRARTPTTIDARPDVDTLSPLGTRALTVTVRDQSGAVLPSAPVVWRSLTPNLAGVTSGGAMTAIAAGQALVEAASPRPAPADSLRDTVRVLIVAACSLVRPVSVGTTFAGSIDASTCQNLYGYRVANQYSITTLTQAYFSIKLTPTIATTLVPLNIGSALYGLPGTDTSTTSLVVIRPGTFGFMIAAPDTNSSTYSVTTQADPDSRLNCFPTDVTTGVSFRTAVTPTCTSRDIRILPGLTVGQQVRITATAASYPVTIELTNSATRAVLQRATATAAGATATIALTNNNGAAPRVVLKVLGGTTVNDLVTVTIAQ